MRLSFRIGNEFLELSPGTVLELEEENPFLQLGNETTGEYSLPFTVPASHNNMRLLGYVNVLPMRKITEGVEAVCYIDSIEHSRGRIKIERGDGNMNRPMAGMVSLYYLFGLSAFWKAVETKFLTDCAAGPDISFPAAEYYLDPGFMNHVYQVINAPVGAYDYCFCPVINTSGLMGRPDVPGSFAMNNVCWWNDDTMVVPAPRSIDKELTDTLFPPKNEWCPFPYLHQVIRRVFTEFKYTVKGEMLDEADFKKIILLHCNPIEWIEPTSTGGVVTWNMKDMVPRVKVGTFLNGLATRFGWWYDFDYGSRTVTIRKRKSVLDGRKQTEATARAGAAYNYTMNEAGAVYGLATATGEEKFKMDNYIDKGTAFNRFQLPAASQAQEKHLYFVLGENAYVFCTEDIEGNWVWEKAADNVFNYKPANQTEELVTNCLIPGTDLCPLGYYIQGPIGDANYPKRMAVPVVTLNQGETETFYIAYNHGVCTSVNDQGSPVNWLYPMSGAGCHDLYGNVKTQASLAFEYPETPAIDRGLYKNEWEYYFSLLRARESVTIPIQVDMTDLLNSEYTDTLIIQGVEYWIKNTKFTLPLQPTANMELIRI